MNLENLTEIEKNVSFCRPIATYFSSSCFIKGEINDCVFIKDKIYHGVAVLSVFISLFPLRTGPVHCRWPRWNPSKGFFHIFYCSWVITAHCVSGRLRPVFSFSLLSRFYSEYSHILCKCVTWWRSVMSQSHRIKGETTDQMFQALQERRILWERGAPRCLFFLTLKTFYMQNNLYSEKAQ